MLHSSVHNTLSVDPRAPITWRVQVVFWLLAGFILLVVGVWLGQGSRYSDAGPRSVAEATASVRPLGSEVKSKLESRPAAATVLVPEDTQLNGLAQLQDVPALMRWLTSSSVPTNPATSSIPTKALLKNVWLLNRLVTPPGN